MLDEYEVREALCEVGRRVWTRNYIASNDGNLSFRLDENRVLCTPTMISKGFMKPDDMVIMDLQGNQLAGARKATSEAKIHLYIYQQRPDVHSVVHVHPPHATAFAIARRELPKCVLPEIELFLGEIPLAPYATTGTWEFARTIEPWVRNHDCFLLTNHGAVTVGQDPFDAYYKMETLDQYCRILLLAKQIGDWNTINIEGIRDLLNLKQKMGVADPRTNCEPCNAGAQASTTMKTPGYFQVHPGPMVDAPKLGPVHKEQPMQSQAPQQRSPQNADVNLNAIVEEVVRRVLRNNS
ncbi:class II aldolase/adducin family protein [soil metagenome]